VKVDLSVGTAIRRGWQISLVETTAQDKCIKVTGNVQDVEETSQNFHLNQIQPELISLNAETVLESKTNKNTRAVGAGIFEFT